MALPFYWEISVMPTLAPDATNLSTMPRPKPEAPPVTIATLPLKKIIKVYFSVS